MDKRAIENLFARVATDRGLTAAERGEIATDKEVEAVFAKYRRT